VARNPFTPTFGVSPPLLVAREDELASFAEALDDGPGAPGRAMLFTRPGGVLPERGVDRGGWGPGALRRLAGWQCEIGSDRGSPGVAYADSMG